MCDTSILEKIVAICKAHDVQEVILFGSRAKNTDHGKSDYDIAVSGVSDFDSLEEDIDNIDTLFKIDLVNLDRCFNQLFLEDVREYGRKIL